MSPIAPEPAFSHTVTGRCGKARLGVLITPHGQAPTPAFMPVGTAGSIKGVTPDQVRSAGVHMILANTYHLMLRPGAAAVAQLGGLHRLMNWDGPILTDSGGYQVFSLAHLRRLDADGVEFNSHVDGSPVRLTPRLAIEIQQQLGADVMMQLDECPPADAPREQVERAVLRSAAALLELDLSGYAIGGLSVGEGHQAMAATREAIDAQLPRARPRYLMGVGEPRDILTAVAAGVDMFDCVLPTRNGRNAQAFTFGGRVRLRNARHALDNAPLEQGCDCYACGHYSRGALRHLFMAGEMLGPTLVSIHNLRFFARLMERIRRSIADGTFPSQRRAWLEGMYPRGRAMDNDESD